MTLIPPPKPVVPLFDLLEQWTLPERQAVQPPAPIDKWVGFISIMANNDPTFIDATPHLGMFELSVRRLCDLGYMENPKRYPKAGKLVWSATWIPPYSLMKFLGQPKLQYQAFVRSMKEYANAPGLLPLVGASIDTKKATLSGVIAVAHKAGHDGAMSWFMNSKDRRKFKPTTETFYRANGIF